MSGFNSGGNPDLVPMHEESSTATVMDDSAGASSQSDSGGQPVGGTATAQGAATMGTGTAGTTTTTDFDPKQWELKFHDKVYYPNDRDHLIKLAQQGWSYDKRMREFNLKEKEMNDTRQKYEELKRLSDFFDQNPEFAKYVNDGYAQFYSGVKPVNGGEQQQAQSSQIPPELLKRIEEQENRIKSWEQAQADKEVAEELETLKKNHPDHQWDGEDENGVTLEKQLLKFAIDNGAKTLENAYRLMFFDKIQENIKAETLRKAQEEQQKAAKAGIVTGVQPSVRKPDKPEIDIRKSRYTDITKAAQEALATMK